MLCTVICPVRSIAFPAFSTFPVSLSAAIALSLSTPLISSNCSLINSLFLVQELAEDTADQAVKLKTRHEKIVKTLSAQWRLFSARIMFQLLIRFKAVVDLDYTQHTINIVCWFLCCSLCWLSPVNLFTSCSVFRNDECFSVWKFITQRTFQRFSDPTFQP